MEVLTKIFDRMLGKKLYLLMQKVSFSRQIMKYGKLGTFLLTLTKIFPTNGGGMKGEMDAEWCLVGNCGGKWADLWGFG